MRHNLIYWLKVVALVVENPHTSVGNIRDRGLISGSGRSPGGGHGNPLQCSCLGNPVVRGAWLQSTGPLRVRHDWSDLAQFRCLFIYIYLYVCHLFNCLWHVGSSSLTKERPRPPALGTWSLGHWTTREVLGLFSENWRFSGKFAISCHEHYKDQSVTCYEENGISFPPWLRRLQQVSH